MKNKIIRLFLLLSIITSGLLVCTISDDNGSPSVTGPSDNGDDDSIPVVIMDSTMYIRLLNITPVESGENLDISIYLYSDSLLTKAVAGEEILVTCTTSGVTLSDDTLITNIYGHTSVTFSYTLSDSLEQNIPITFTYNGQSSKTSITVSNDPTTLTQNFMVISARPYNIKADGSSQSTVSVKIKNESFNPIVGEAILFKTDAGDITASGVTNESGIATAILTSEKRNDIANITATLVSDTTKSERIQVEFTGIDLSSSVSPGSISPDGTDSAIVTITLKDANEEEIYGETVFFSTSSTSAATITVIDSTTNTRGQASCIVKSSTTIATSDTIYIKCAGDSTSAVLFYSDNVITITPSPTASLKANGIDTTPVSIKYTTAAGAGIANAVVNVSITAGTIGTSTTYTDTTNSTGDISFTLNNPDFATNLVITATALYNNRITSSKKDVYFKASSIARIVLEGSPEVIETDGDKSALKVICYDAEDNRVNNETVSFRIIDGPGAGEYLDPPIAITDLSGSATAYLYSGTESSKQQQIKVVASSYSGVESNVIYLTIAGTPEYITIRKNIGEISDGGDGTYTKNLSALVTDINRNPVKDSTIVTFSAQIVGYWIYTRTSDYKRMLEFEDQNDNFTFDEGENSKNFTSDPILSTVTVGGAPLQVGYPLGRGEDLVWYPGDNTYNPGPAYYDVNCNGRRDYRSDLWGYEAPTYIDTTLLFDTTGVDSNMVIDTIIVITEKYYDIDGDGFVDSLEPLVNTGISQAEYENVANGWIPGIGYPDYDWSNNNQPDPVTTVIIEKNVPTTKGVAPNFLTYGQTDARRIEVKMWAESKGKESKSPEIFTLPILEEDAKYFDPYEGKKYIFK